ncbi:VOC family protein [Nakamurella sp. YIM 132087]|uniref:VOC family protein n=1 Tax=Nakamurella alba TaxID=2665158 RepID=A0A7K1FJX1_9ACTN|nr:VOC family protein [Nakamurella alba]MTD14435.1 VOC family protein [Nakamurella alba]
MIDHFGIQAADVAASAQFYSTVFAPIGITEAVRFPTGPGPEAGLVVGFSGRSGPPDFWLSPGDGPTRESHFAFAAGGRDEVDAVHQAALDAGVEVLHAPREWPEYHPGYYAVFLRDPDGHNVETVHHG